MKYKLSVQKMTEHLTDISAFNGISLDSKAILLVLAATLPILRFNALVDSIDSISPIRARLQAVNVLRHQFGQDYRNYILIFAMKLSGREISSRELVQLIS